MMTPTSFVRGALPLCLAASGAVSQTCGQWTVVDNPTVNGVETFPIPIAALGPGSAVGIRMAVGGMHRMEWDGVAWEVVSTDALDFSTGWDARSLHANSLDDLWVAGLLVIDNFHGVPFLAHFDGENWEAHEGFLFPDPNPQAGDPVRNAEGGETLYFGDDDVWVIGAGESPEGDTSCPVALHWDGSNLRESTPQIQPAFNRTSYFEAAAGAATDDLWKVGRGRNITQGSRLLSYHWDGSNWTAYLNWTQLPGSNSLQEALRDVSAVGPGAAWAVGEKLILVNGATRSVSLYLRWNGSGWTEVTGPDIGPLTSIAAVNADDIWVSNGYGEYGGRLAHWDGVAWTEFNSAPIPGATHIGLSNLAADAFGEVWAIGDWAIYDGQGGWEVYQNIIEHLSSGCLTLGDIDGDGLVNFADLNLLLDAYNSIGEDMPPDLNDDGLVDFADLNILLGNYNAGA